MQNNESLGRGVISKNSPLGYGLLSKSEALFMAYSVSSSLGGGANATAMIIETSQAETMIGTYLDKYPNRHGVGLVQFDKIGFDDVKNRTRERHKDVIFNDFGININDVEFKQLAYSPLLSVIFCRLKYILIPDAIPATIEGRADYWKVHFNSIAGKGSASEYCRKAEALYSSDIMSDLIKDVGDVNLLSTSAVSKSLHKNIQTYFH